MALETSPWCPAADVIIAFCSHVDLPLLILSSWGHWRLRARLLNFISSPLGSPMDVISFLRRRSFHRGCPPLNAVGLPLVLAAFLCLRPASTPTSCLYAYSLPLIIFTKSTTVIIVTANTVTVIVHFLFKRNSIFLFYVILSFIFFFVIF
jgi:hypothetical protein